MSDIVNIPDLPAGTPPELVNFLQALGEGLSLLQGLGRQLESERALRVSDLQRLGISLNDFSLATQEIPLVIGGLTPSGKAPLPPQNLIMLKGAFVHILQFDIPKDTIINYVEVWVAKNSQLRSNARLADVLTVKDYGIPVEIKMPVDDVTAEYTYWIRTVSFAKNHSIWEPPDAQGGYVVTGEESVQVAIAKIFEILNGQLTEAELYIGLQTKIAKIEVNETNITNEQTIRSNADISLAQSIDTITALAEGNYAAIQTEQTARTDGDTANAQALTTVQTTVNGHTSALQQNLESIDGIKAKYAIKLNVDGHVTGFELMSDGTTGEMIFLSDKIKFVLPDGSGTPIAIIAAGLINDIATLGIDGNMVIDGTVLTRHLEADIIKAKHVDVNELFVGMKIQSTIYEEGTAGYKFDGAAAKFWNIALIIGAGSSGIENFGDAGDLVTQSRDDLDYTDGADVTDYALISASIVAAQTATEEAARITAEAYADGEITAVETRAITDAQAKADVAVAVAQAYTKAWSKEGADVTGDNLAAGTGSVDTRDDNEPPSFYWAKVRGTYDAFKRSDSIGVIGTSRYGTLKTTIPWGDVSGGKITQQFYGGGDVYKRSSINSTTWEVWTSVADGADITDYDAIDESAQAKADAAKALAISTAATAAQAKVDLEAIRADAHADDIVDAEETRAIADAQAKADTAQEAAVNAAATDAQLKADAAQAVAIAATSTITLIAGTGTEVVGNITTKTSGAASWEAHAYSGHSITGGCRLVFKTIRDTDKLMVALNTDPTANVGYQYLDYAVFKRDTDFALFYESGVSKYLDIGGEVAATADTIFEIVYTNSEVIYYADGVELRRIAAPSNLVLFIDSCIYTPGGGFKILKWEPYSDITDYDAIDIAAQDYATAAQNYAVAQDVLLRTAADAYADGEITAVEARAIVDAQAIADTAQEAAEATAQAYTKAWSDEGATDDSDIRYNGDITMIDGGKIHADSQITIGNPVDGDYCRIDDGDIDFYQYLAGGHRHTKSLKRIETGTADNGVEKILPGYWEVQPNILVTSSNLDIYSAAYSSQSQKLITQANSIVETSLNSKIYKFTPLAQLIIASGSAGSSIGYSNSGYSTNAGSVLYVTSPTYAIPMSNIKQIVSSVVKASTYRLTYQFNYPSWTYYYTGANCRVRLDYYTNGAWVTGAWSNSQPSRDGLVSWTLSTPIVPNDITIIRAVLESESYPIVIESKSKNPFGLGALGKYGTVVLDSYSANLPGSTVLATGTINWMAIG